MNQRKLAEALGISGAMVSKLKARGMPVTSVAAAAAWRRRHLSPGHVYRIDRLHRQRPQQHADDDADPDRALDAVELLGIAAELLLRAGQPLTAMEPLLRQALRSVPEEHRDRVLLRLDDDEVCRLRGKLPRHDPPTDGCVAFPLSVWNVLIAPLMRVAREEQDKVNDGGDPMDDDDAAAFADVCYRVAAGELVPQ